MSDEPIIRELNDLGAALQQQPSLRTEVMRRVTQSALAAPRVSSMPHRTWRALAALAACLLIGLALVQLLGGNGASRAFADAIDRVAKARTFSCREISESVRPDGTVQTHETIYMFKEPDRSRMELGTGFDSGEGQVTITDYGKHQRLTLLSKDKAADLQDTRSNYVVDAATGDLKLEQLYTEPRDQVLKLTAEAVKDLGTAQLNDKTVRVLESHGKETIRTIYVDPETKLPVKIVIDWPNKGHAAYTYAGIKIDADLDDKLFSLGVPEGYKLFKDGPYLPASEYYAKMMTKMRQLSLACIEYANDHNGEYPADLTNLTGAGGLSEQVLTKLLASPDKPNSPAAIVYRRPRPGKQSSAEIILYESPDQRRDGNVAAAMQDGHAEVMKQAYFDEMMSK